MATYQNHYLKKKNNVELKPELKPAEYWILQTTRNCTGASKQSLFSKKKKC